MSKMTPQEYSCEFEIMVRELSCKEGVKFDALCRISESFLKPYISNLCRKYKVLRDITDIGEDLYHDVLVCLIKSCIDQFLYRDGTLNNDSEGFLRWIYTITRNTVTSSAKRYGEKICAETDIVDDGGEIIDIPSNIDNPLVTIEARETLKECFGAVLSSDNALHISFTWILRAVLLSRCDMSLTLEDGIAESKVNALVAETFGELTLGEIYAVILLESRSMPWLDINENDNKRIRDKLSEPFSNGRPLEDIRYSELFMKKGGKATVSDWVNRVNMRIIKAVDAKY